MINLHDEITTTSGVSSARVSDSPSNATDEETGTRVSSAKRRTASDPEAVDLRTRLTRKLRTSDLSADNAVGPSPISRALGRAGS